MINFLRKIFGPLIDRIVLIIGKTTWKQKNFLSPEDKKKIIDMLAKDYYIILTRRSNHLSTYAISFTNFFLTGKFGYYAHALMNVEGAVNSIDDIRLIEATAKGTNLGTFEEILGSVTSIVLLQPKNMDITHWTNVLDKAKTYLGTPYDTLYDLASDKSISCVELVKLALEGEPNYATDFAEFEKMINKYKNLAPHMFRMCSDFEVALEIKK